MNQENDDLPGCIIYIIVVIIISFLIYVFETVTEKECIKTERYTYEIPRDINDSYEFDSSICTDDCEWHTAWYERAYDREVDSCWWNSESFVEWCEIYLNEKNKYIESKVVWCRSDSPEYQYENRYNEDYSNEY